MSMNTKASNREDIMAGTNLYQTNLPVVGVFREQRNIEYFEFKAPQYEQAYHELYDCIEQQGAYVAVLMGQGTYLGDGVFTKHWAQVKADDGYVFEKRGPIKVDMIYVKDEFTVPPSDQALQVNSQDFRAVATDKNATYDLLGDFHPVSLTVSSKLELKKAFHNIPGDNIAVKIPQGNSGKGVFVGKKSDFDSKKFLFDFPWQVQEYVETSVGIPGIVQGRHDFRVVLINGDPVISTLRTPPANGLKSNISYGGKTHLIDRSQIPLDLLELCKQIDVKLASLGQYRFYSADFGMTDRGWVLFEINAMPGTINLARGEQAVYYQDRLAKFLAAAARNEMGKNR